MSSKTYVLKAWSSSLVLQRSDRNFCRCGMVGSECALEELWGLSIPTLFPFPLSSVLSSLTPFLPPSLLPFPSSSSCLHSSLFLLLSWVPEGERLHSTCSRPCWLCVDIEPKATEPAVRGQRPLKQGAGQKPL